MMNFEQIAEFSIKMHEGFMSLPYDDANGFHIKIKGKMTVGWGHNLQEPMSKELGEVILKYDMKWAIAACQEFDFFHKLTKVRKAALVDMMYNLGYPSFCEFKQMISDLENRNFDGAAFEMQQSLWYEQVPKRVEDLMYMMNNDRLPQKWIDQNE